MLRSKLINTRKLSLSLKYNRLWYKWLRCSMWNIYVLYISNFESNGELFFAPIFFVGICPFVKKLLFFHSNKITQKHFIHLLYNFFYFFLFYDFLFNLVQYFKTIFKVKSWLRIQNNLFVLKSKD